MKKNLIAYLFFVFAFDSCGPKFYFKNEYAFYRENFELDEASLLKTNGIYVLDSIWSQSTINKSDQKLKKTFYIFYKTGQSNMIISDVVTEDYKKLIIDDYYRSKKNKHLGTLFQGYYKIKDNKIIIEKVNTSLKQFNYSYGYLENDKLIIVKPNSLQGEGKFEDNYFLNTYKEIYKFIPLEDLDAISPYW
ncbi:conserved hypothetical protein [Flavobacterium sp. 9AF]|uniref:hypothetical protein n=1 Tax=Flavobacterium sp. 9AF TaxID=2653142 RepID=UPI0012F33A33|nr:hypothetical protein [Flavobacterium sp. 9AF]VXC01826.1 conserved hypothetical protein [Flavobacterium sp. 9AF]